MISVNHEIPRGLEQKAINGTKSFWFFFQSGAWLSYDLKKKSNPDLGSKYDRVNR